MSFNFFWIHVCMKVLPKAQPGDVLVFVFAGHGCQVRKLLHFRIALAWHGLHASISSIISTCSTNFTCFDASNVWIAWQVRLPGGELEDALVPCDSAQGVVPLTAILASWKYWGRVLQSGVFYQKCLPLPVDLPWNVANAVHETQLQIHILTDPADGTMDWALPRYCATNSMRSSHGCRLGVTLQSS